MKKGKVLLQLFLMYVVVLAALCFVMEGPNYIGKSYYNTNQFEYEEQEFREGLTKYVLQDVPEEEMRKQLLTVSAEELAHYREYYGSLSEQVSNLMDQYQNRVEDNALSDEVRELVRAERDKKIADIKLNFEDDAHAKAKVLALKEKALNNYLAEFQREKNSFLTNFSYFQYELKNVETGEAFKKGDVTKNVLYRFSYTEKDNFFSYDATRPIYLADYLNDGEGLLPSERVLEYKPATFTGSVIISKAAAGDIVLSMQAFKYTKIIYYVLFGAGIISLVLLLTTVRPEKAAFDFWPHLKAKLARRPVDLVAVSWLVLAWFTVLLMSAAINTVHAVSYFDRAHYGFFNALELLVLIAISFFLFSATLLSGLWLYDRIRMQTGVKETFLYKIWQAGEQLFLNRSIGKQSLAMLVIVFLAGFGFMIALMDGEFFLLYLPLFFFIFLPTLYVFMRRMGYLNKIMAQTKDMAEGRLTGDLVVKGKSPLAHHAENLNKLRDGVRESMTEQAKSERLKTELITNVSHDLRTPLTSIITYTDLLKNPDLTDEERTKYINILEVKSARLKTLIEDLFEVSKMASGNVELLRAQVDLAQLLQQAIGEHEEDFAAAGLDLRVTIAEQPILAIVDGQKWWRAIDNLIVNARKYSLEGTRVYVQLKADYGVVELTVKNVAKYELNEDATELVERFKRADTSRHTDGSGLGLAIAQSIVDLHSGTMNIQVDGDLFKVTVSVPMK